MLLWSNLWSPQTSSVSTHFWTHPRSNIYIYVLYIPQHIPMIYTIAHSVAAGSYHCKCSHWNDILIYPNYGWLYDVKHHHLWLVPQYWVSPLWLVNIPNWYPQQYDWLLSKYIPVHPNIYIINDYISIYYIHIYIYTYTYPHYGSSWLVQIPIIYISYITHPFIPLGGIPSLPCRSNSPADAAALLVPPVSPTGSLGTPGDCWFSAYLHTQLLPTR